MWETYFEVPLRKPVRARVSADARLVGRVGKIAGTQTSDADDARAPPYLYARVWKIPDPVI